MYSTEIINSELAQIYLQSDGNKHNLIVQNMLERDNMRRHYGQKKKKICLFHVCKAVQPDNAKMSVFLLSKLISTFFLPALESWIQRRMVWMEMLYKIEVEWNFDRVALFLRQRFDIKSEGNYYDVIGMKK